LDMARTARDPRARDILKHLAEVTAHQSFFSSAKYLALAVRAVACIASAAVHHPTSPMC